jgi:hypothetical protein
MQGGHPRWRLGVHHCLPWWACRVSSGRTLGSVLAALVLAIVLLGGCASIPSDPSVMVLPGTGKTFEQFQTDDAVCRHSVQGRYDIAYRQCMYAKGNQVPW